MLTSLSNAAMPTVVSTLAFSLSVSFCMRLVHHKRHLQDTTHANVDEDGEAAWLPCKSSKSNKAPTEASRSAGRAALARQQQVIDATRNRQRRAKIEKRKRLASLLQPSASQTNVQSATEAATRDGHYGCPVIVEAEPRMDSQVDLPPSNDSKNSRDESSDFDIYQSMTVRLHKK